VTASACSRQLRTPGLIASEKPTYQGFIVIKGSNLYPESMAGMEFGSSWKDQVPDARLYFGLFILLIAVIQLVIGKTWGRNGQGVSRSVSPKTYWLGIGSYILAGALLIWLWGVNFRF
jgi:hypothetical protein